MRPIVIAVGPLASASATNIRTASSIAGSGAVTLNGTTVSGGVATLDTQRRVLFTSAGNDSGITFTISGTNNNKDLISETLTGGNATGVYTVLDYKTVTSVTASGASAGNVSIGTNGIAGSPWVMLDPWADPTVSIQINVSGTANYTVQQTLDDPNDPMNAVSAASVTWINSADTNVVGATAAAQSNYNFVPRYTRILLNSGSGTVTGTFIQTGVVYL
jgi:hypothetical protein